MKRAKPSKPGTYARFVEDVAWIHSLPKAKTRTLLEYAFANIAHTTWRDGRISIPGLATFRVRERKARNVRNPDTDMPMVVPAHRVVVARVAKGWRTK